jgi:hypothetical protein
VWRRASLPINCSMVIECRGSHRRAAFGYSKGLRREHVRGSPARRMCEEVGDPAAPVQRQVTNCAVHEAEIARKQGREKQRLTSRLVRPEPQPITGDQLAWCTNREAIHPRDLGLSSPQNRMRRTTVQRVWAGQTTTGH